jgi:large subunit ribosomal protein L21
LNWHNFEAPKKQRTFAPLKKRGTLMYAIVEIAGHQYKVQQDQRVYVNRLPQDEGAKISFDRVLLVDNGSQIDVGAPAVKGATVNAVIERHLKGDKVMQRRTDSVLR